MAMTYRGYELSQASIVGGGVNIAKDGEFVDKIIGDMALARHTVDQIIEEDQG